MTYNVFGGTLSLTQSVNRCSLKTHMFDWDCSRSVFFVMPLINCITSSVIIALLLLQVMTSK